MEHLGFNGWFGPLSREDDGAATVHEALSSLGLKKQGRQPLVPGKPTHYHAKRASLPVFVGETRPWCEIILHPIEKQALDALGHDQLCALLMQLSDKIRVAIGRTCDESLHGAVREREIQSGVEWLDWFQYWGPTVVSRWGVDRVRSGPFRRAEVLATGGCALTLFDGPEDPLQIPLKVEAAAYLGIKLRPFRVGHCDIYKHRPTRRGAGDYGFLERKTFQRDVNPNPRWGTQQQNAVESRELRRVVNQSRILEKQLLDEGLLAAEASQQGQSHVDFSVVRPNVAPPNRR